MTLPLGLNARAWGEEPDEARAAAFGAGPWTAVLTPYGVEQVEYQGLPVSPRIFFSVRDERWRSPEILLDWKSDGTRAPTPTAVLSGRVAGQPIAVRGRVSVSDDALRIAFALEVESDVEVARAGPCVLFEPPPPGAVITTDRQSDGVCTVSEVIAPRPVVSAFTHLVIPVRDALLAVELTGASYEMEDQRNWGDATLKVYCPPLDVARPLRLGPGTPRDFTLTFRIERASAQCTPRLHRPSTQVKSDDVVLGARVVQRPSLGLTHPGGPLDDATLSQIATVAPAFLHLLVDLSAPNWADTLRFDLAVAASLSAPAVLTVECSDEGALAALADQCAGAVDVAFVFRPHEATTAEVLAEHARTAFAGSGIRVGGGSRGHYASINVAGKVPDAVEVVAIPIAGAAHDDDRRSLTTGPTSFPALVASARRLAPGREIYLGPVGLAPTFDSWSPPTVAAPVREAWDWGHRRHATSFGAAWAIAAYAALAPLGVERICIAGTVGARGLGHLSADRFVPYPLLSALQQLSALGSGPVAALQPGRRVAGLATPERALLGVMTDEPWMPDSRWPAVIASATVDPPCRRPDGRIESPDVVTMGHGSGASA